MYKDNLHFQVQIIIIYKNAIAITALDLWQNRGACSFIKIEIQQNQSLTSLGSKLLDTNRSFKRNLKVKSL